MQTHFIQQVVWLWLILGHLLLLPTCSCGLVEENTYSSASVSINTDQYLCCSRRKHRIIKSSDHWIVAMWQQMAVKYFMVFYCVAMG